MAKTLSVADKSWQAHNEEQHGLRRNRVGMLYRSFRHPTAHLDTTEHSEFFATHDHIHCQGSLYLRGDRNDDGTPAMKPEVVRHMNASYNATKGRTYLEVAEVAGLLHLSTAAVYRMIRTRKIASKRPSGGDGPIHITFPALESYMKENGYTSDEIADTATEARNLTMPPTA